MYNLKKFESVRAKVVDKITVTRNQSIGFPTGFYRDHKISDFKYVVLYYDSEQRAIGIDFTNDGEEKSKFTIIHSKDGYGGSIIARSFFTSNGIDAKKYYGRYSWEKYPVESVGEIFVIKLIERQPIVAEATVNPQP